MESIVNLNQFKCEMCGGIFDKERSDEETQAEAQELWNIDKLPEEEQAIVCDDCFKIITRGLFN